ncbi:MAG: nucleotide exchange factor GrpE [bacterium]
MSRKRNGPVSELEERLAQFHSRCEDAARREAEHRDSALRAAADFENYRRRTRQELAEARERGVEAVLADLVAVLDSFDRALAVGANQNPTEAVLKGLSLIQRQLCSVLEAHGLRRYSCIGEQFDPRRAEAVGFVPDTGDVPETVVSEDCCGYECQGRVVRPARVFVARPSRDEDGPGLNAEQD